MADVDRNVRISATGGVDPDVECEADVDVRFDKDGLTYIKIKVKYVNLGFGGWNRYRVFLYLCTSGDQPNLLFGFYTIYIYGIKGMLLMTKFIFVVKELIKESSGILAVGGMDIFYGRVKSLCYELEKRVKIFNENYHNSVTPELTGKEEVFLE